MLNSTAIPHGCLELHLVTALSMQFLSPLPGNKNFQHIILDNVLVNLVVCWIAKENVRLSSSDLKRITADCRRCYNKHYSRNRTRCCSPVYAIRKVTLNKNTHANSIQRSCNGNNIILCTTCCVQQAVIDCADGRKFRLFAIIGVPEVDRDALKAFVCVLLSTEHCSCALSDFPSCV